MTFIEQIFRYAKVAVAIFPAKVAFSDMSMGSTEHPPSGPSADLVKPEHNTFAHRSDTLVCGITELRESFVSCCLPSLEGLRQICSAPTPPHLHATHPLSVCTREELMEIVVDRLASQ